MAQKRRKPVVGEPSVMETALDKDDCFVLNKACDYLLGVLKKYPVLDRDILEFSCWALGTRVLDLIQGLDKKFGKKQTQSLREDLENSLDFEDHAQAFIRALKHERSKGAKLLYMLQENLEYRQNELQTATPSKLEKNASKFEELFDLSREEMEICLFFFLVSGWDQFRRLFHNHLKVEEYSGRKYLLAALDMSQTSLERSLSGRLRRLGIVTPGRLELSLNEDILALFIDPKNNVAPDSLFQKAPQSEIPLDYHMLPPEEVEFLNALLEEKRESPAHILFYGPAGTGKTSFARALADSHQDPAYEILQGDRNEASKRRAALQACLNMTNSGSGSVLIVDEADQLLNTGEKLFFQGEIRDKGWLNSFLEEPRVRAIWIVNRTEGIEESVLRRFAYSKYFPYFSRHKRIQLWKTAAKHNKVGKFLKEPTIRRLAEEYNVSAGVIDNALKQAKASSGVRNLTFVKRLRLALDAHLRLQNQGAPAEKKGLLARDFTLQGLNIRISPEHILHRLQKFTSGTEYGGGDLGQYLMLFYGPPGTGKSELAKYLANKLDRDLMQRRSSDLLDPYLGRTEKNIAEMFAEAEAREAVLVVDEADSFIFGREIASRSWEISQVNEFLTRMESFQGILICTTNRFQGMDRASVRRFQEKVFFDYLTSQGIETLYKKLLEPLCSKSLSKSALARLTSIKGLTPGDFKNIRNRHICHSKKPSHDALISALEEEVSLKDEQQGKVRAGFKLS